MSSPISKPWLGQYPAGVPADINPDEFSSINEVLAQSVARYADRAAFTCMGKTLSYREVDRLSLAIAGYLSHRLQLQHGDRVAIMLPNVLQYPLAIFGSLRAGLTVVNTNPMYTARELRHQLRDSGAKVVIALENFADVLAEVLPDTGVQHVVITGIGDLLGFPKSVITNFVVRRIKKLVPAYTIDNTTQFTQMLQQGARLSPPAVTVNGEDLAFLQYTGGTTGVAKGAMLSHRNLVANMEQSAAWLGTDLKYGEEVIVTALPLYHIFALTANCLVFMKFGGCNYLITNPRDMADFVKQIKTLRFSAITGVNTLFNGLLNTPGFEAVDFSALRLSLGGGMAVQRAVAERWQQVTGSTLVEAYGLTETSPACCINPMTLTEYNASIGLPLPSTDCVIVRDDGALAAADEDGELCVKGPQVMQGYWQRPAETAKVMTVDGYLRTGDIAQMSAAGFFHIVDRKKDMILVSGFNVYPNEIEDVVAAHPMVLEVAAVGEPDTKSGEAVKICVVKKDAALTAEALRDYCKQHLTAYKVPKLIEFFDELPKSNVGKILRRELRSAAN